MRVSVVAAAGPSATRPGGAGNTARATSRTPVDAGVEHVPGYHGGGGRQGEQDGGAAGPRGRAAGAGGSPAAGAGGAEGEAGGPAGDPGREVGVLLLRRGARV